MAYKRTGNPVGRPKTKEYVTLLARVPADLAALVKKYADQHRISVATVLREGAEWRIGDGDPRGTGLYLDEPVGIREQVYHSNTGNSTVVPEQLGNAGMLQEFRGMLEPLQAQIDALTQTLERQTALGSNGVLRNTSMASGGSVDPVEPVPGGKDVPDFDPARHHLGSLCRNKHAWGSSGQSLRNADNQCLECRALAKRAKDARKKAERAAQPVAG